MSEFLSYPFFQRALLAGLLAALLCGTLSFFVILRRLAFVGSGIAHAAFGGVALAALFGLPPAAGGLAAAILVAVATSHAAGSGHVSEDAAVGVFTVAAMAAGVVALGFVRTNVDLFGLMFGNILTVAPSDLTLLAVAGLLVLATLAYYFRPLLYASVDEEGAEASGIDIGRMRLLLFCLLGVTVVVSIKVVGILLVSALLVLPGAAARPLAARWPALLAISVGAAVVTVEGGLLASVVADVPPGGAIILGGSVLFVGALAVSRLRQPG